MITNILDHTVLKEIQEKIIFPLMEYFNYLNMLLLGIHYQNAFLDFYCVDFVFKNDQSVVENRSLILSEKRWF